jgi:hypothetical protein
MNQIGYQTPWWLFLGILAVYIALSLFIGGKKAYFEPYLEPKEENEPTPEAQI